MMLLALAIIVSLFSELLISNRAIVVRYDGAIYFPTYGSYLPGSTFDLPYEYETNYRELQKRMQLNGEDGFVLLPLVPYSEYETDLRIESGNHPPYAPDFSQRHFLGTDSAGRDIVARLVYGFRIAFAFSLLLLLCNYSIGVSVGCLMGYWGGKFDLFFQRVIEIWSNIPFLYVIMIIASIMIPTFWTLIMIMVFFGWMSITWYMRTSTYKEKAREYVMAAQALGASRWRVIFGHILPNSVSLLVTFAPFSIATGFTSLTALDYLGFGLPAPTPSWGELLRQGTDHLESEWIVSSVVTAMVLVLIMVTFIGEAVREAFDPKLHTTYE